MSKPSNNPVLSLFEALAVLSRLQTAAPPATAGKLAEVIALVESLSDENAYLSTLLLEQQSELDWGAASPSASAESLPAPSPPESPPVLLLPAPPLPASPPQFTSGGTTILAQSVVQGDIESTESGTPDFLRERPVSADEEPPSPPPPVSGATTILPESGLAEDIESSRSHMPRFLRERLITNDEPDATSRLRARLQAAVRDESKLPPPANPGATGVLRARQVPADAEPAPPTVSGEAAPDDALVPALNQALQPILNTIGQLVDTLFLPDTGPLTAAQVETLEIIAENAYLGAAALDGVERLKALRGGTMTLVRVRLECDELLSAGHRQIAHLAERKGHGIIVHPAEGIRPALGDLDQTLTIFTDILENAIAYTPFGGEIQLSAENLGDHVLFSVADSGIGLNAEDMDEIGQPFWRALYSPLVRAHPGMGLRLYLAREILAMQRGELIFSGEPDVGSTFSFTLPVAP